MPSVPDACLMRSFTILAGIALVAALVAIPAAGATCHFCVFPEPVSEILHRALP